MAALVRCKFVIKRFLENHIMGWRQFYTEFPQPLRKILLNKACMETNVEVRVCRPLALSPGFLVGKFLVCRRLNFHLSLVSSSINIDIGQSFIKCCNSICNPLLKFPTNNIAAMSRSNSSQRGCVKLVQAAGGVPMQDPYCATLRAYGR